MKWFFYKLGQRILYAFKLIDKRELKARIRKRGLLHGENAAFHSKYGTELYPGIWRFEFDRVKVGEGSYGGLNVLVNGEGDAKLEIGRYCSIAYGVKFILQSEHPYRGIATYPFKVKCGLQKEEASSKGSIVVGDDVWIGMDAIICSGVKIGQGAIIAAGSVVVKDVEPYSIVGGNPAKHIKYRYDDPELRKRMEKLDWSRFDRSKLTLESADRLYARATRENLDGIIAEFFGAKGGN